MGGEGRPQYHHLCCYLQDETLVHCSLSRLENPDFIFDVEFDGLLHEVSENLAPLNKGHTQLSLIGREAVFISEVIVHAIFSRYQSG